MSVFGTGSHAEYIAVPEDGIIESIPLGRTMIEAVALTDGPLTAIPFLRDRAHLAAGQRILINGGSSSVGLAAIQYAKHLGAHVTAVTSTGNAGLVTRAGADTVIDYTREDFTRSTERYDVIFDAVGKSSWSRSRRVLAPNGIYLTTVPSLGILTAQLWTRLAGTRKAGIAFTGLLPTADKLRDLRVVRELSVQGALEPVIDGTYAFSDPEAVRAAHARVDTGRKTGNVVLVIAET
jgi:NADPH:quinone reductase-like Zn-dependent oxidoreductase